MFLKTHQKNLYISSIKKNSFEQKQIFTIFVYYLIFVYVYLLSENDMPIAVYLCYSDNGDR